MTKSRSLQIFFFIAIMSIFACRRTGIETPTTLPNPDPLPTSEGVVQNKALWDLVREEIDNADFEEITVIIGDKTGNLFSYSKGASSPDKIYALASASKWLSSATIMRLVEQGILDLEDHPQKYIPWWTNDPADPRSQVTLAHLLSFTSGFNLGAFESSCVGDRKTTLDACGQILYEEYFEFSPSTTFYYGPAHLHIAALMAEYATGKDYNAIFQEQIANPLGLNPGTGFFTPSLENPRAAGGASSTPNDYARFLQAIISGEILSDSFELMITDHTPTSSVIIDTSPVTRQGYEWHYGFGLWRECLSKTWQPDCTKNIFISSPGAFGWYPWIDLENEYYGLIAVEEKIRILNRPSEESVEFGILLRPLIEAALEN
ncbi:MAG: beta-lactamase family protein [Chloroflexi bacterium]|jgi:serine-type D-Ala-D-Ala carboxypeptidase/endopeptidase|nr:beta-lactamase family protein [Chloroflexota bacterium]MBT3668827.1 beta-lactamase family protein [Chloroflexota bacterium]MBT4003792.1 beta-lactamase family protein [Chloroflexota bacterium]MBT4306541.1 beta-lactamase family protein [Chloroflexota bacterium]MBT4533925.1 beta-lactamase family protein [Chloroflexota bacterium]